MSLGERAIITCPPNYAYGGQAVGGVIPANSTLLFDVQLISFKWNPIKNSHDWMFEYFWN